MKKFVLAVAMGVACCSMAAVAQGMGGMQMGHDGKALPSPRKMADVDLKGTKVMISYGAPSMRGRKIFGGLVPYNTWWRTGANEATSFETTGNLKVGTLNVPAGEIHAGDAAQRGHLAAGGVQAHRAVGHGAVREG